MRDKLTKVIAIVGPTAVGKSKLAVELAKQLNGEVINADAMQMYKGLDIATNKVTEEEMEGIPHHLLGVEEPLHYEITVHDFVREATRTIDEISSRNRIPIIVGGTHYYIQSLLWPSSLAQPTKDDKDITTCVSTVFTCQIPPDTKSDIQEAIDSQDSPQMHQMLSKVDPKMAERWHVNDIRKIQRSLEYFLSTGGLKHSDHIKSSLKSIESKYSAIILCLQCTDKSLLIDKLNERVDQMINRGLLDELDQMWKLISDSSLVAPSKEVDYTRGILQTIGFKEFHGYLHGNSTVEESVELMKISTRQYAQKQNKWLRNRLFPFIRQTNTPFYVFATDLSSSAHWNHQVLEPSLRIVNAYLNDGILLDPRVDVPEMSGNVYWDVFASKYESSSSMAMVFETWKKYTCDTCSVTLNGLREWNAHMISKGHRKQLEYNKRQMKNVLR